MPRPHSLSLPADTHLQQTLVQLINSTWKWHFWIYFYPLPSYMWPPRLSSEPILSWQENSVSLKTFLLISAAGTVLCWCLCSWQTYACHETGSHQTTTLQINGKLLTVEGVTALEFRSHTVKRNLLNGFGPIGFEQWKLTCSALQMAPANSRPLWLMGEAESRQQFVTKKGWGLLTGNWELCMRAQGALDDYSQIKA